jgi:hypothetical protein
MPQVLRKPCGIDSAVGSHAKLQEVVTLRVGKQRGYGGNSGGMPNERKHGFFHVIRIVEAVFLVTRSAVDIPIAAHSSLQ